METIITIVTSVVAGVLVFILQSVIRENRNLLREREAKKAEKESALENGVKMLLSVNLEEIYDKYANSTIISSRAYSQWKNLYRAYKGLNGNGTFVHMDEEMDDKHIVNK